MCIELYTWNLSVSQRTAQGEACEGVTLWTGARMEAFIFSCASGCLLVKSMFTVYILVGLCLSLLISAHLATYLNNLESQIVSRLPHILSSCLFSTILCLFSTILSYL